MQSFDGAELLRDFNGRHIYPGRWVLLEFSNNVKFALVKESQDKLIIKTEGEIVEHNPNYCLVVEDYQIPTYIRKAILRD